MACRPGGVTPPGTPLCFGNTASGNPCPCGTDPLGAGIRCAGGSLVRLKVKLTDASDYADSSPMVVTVRSASFGHVIQAGETPYYQWWFRDSNGSPCTSEGSTSNGYTITWAP